MKKIISFADHADYLRTLSDQITSIEDRIGKINKKLLKFDKTHEFSYQTRQPIELGRHDYGRTAGTHSNITPFPTLNLKSVQKQSTGPLLAVPGKRLPEGIPDFRPLLQRDGLILLAWDRRNTEMGERFTAYWVTSNGVPRFYASKQYEAGNFCSAQPDHKSYAAEDGIEFYGQEAPAYIVHVAPELMMSNPRHKELRHGHIKTLKNHGSAIDFNYMYLLTREKNLNPSDKRQKNLQDQPAGA